MFYVYLLKDKNGRIYTGMTKDLKRRISEHGQNKTWTVRRMENAELVFYEAFKSKEDAVRRERYFKTSKGKNSLRQIIRKSIL